MVMAQPRPFDFVEEWNNFIKRRYPMHTEQQARYSLILLKRNWHYKLIAEAMYREVLARIEERWPQLKE
jgi:hypothetical protein